MKVLFFGTPLFSEIVLKKIIEKHEVVGVICQPDKPANRGKKLKSPEIKKLAESMGVIVYQFDRLKDNLETIKNIDCDIFVTASYGKILPKELLDMKLCINVHPSMLPKYRGATPIQTALLNGDKKTGVTIMKTDVGMDDGDIILQKEVEILDADDYNSLMPKLADDGAELLLQALEEIENKTVKFIKQDDSKATFTKLVQKEDALLNFNESAETLVNKVRAYVENPTAYFFLGEDRIKVYKAEVEAGDLPNVGIGDVVTVNKKMFLIKTAKDTFSILKCQAPGGKVLDVKDFLNGYRF